MVGKSEWISTSFVEHLRSVCASLGISIGHHLDGLLKPTWTEANPDGTVAIGAHDELWRLIAREAGVSAFAETAASVCTPASLGLVGHLVGASSDLGEAADMLGRYGHLAGPPYVAPKVRVRSGRVALVFPVPEELGQARERGDVSTLSLLTVATSLARDPELCVPCEIRLQHKDPKNQWWYDERFRCPVLFGCTETAVVFPFGPHVLSEISLRQPYGDLSTYLRRQVAAIPLTTDEPSRTYTGLVREVVSRSLHMGKAQIGNTAVSLGTSERTLQRYLNSEGTTFEQILDAVRKELADAYLCSSDLSVREIAKLTGYGDASQFVRAFRRWHPEHTPIAYRQKERRG